MAMPHRLQLLLDEERYERVADVARRQRTSVAPMDVPGGDELLAELRDLRGRRG